LGGKNILVILSSILTFLAFPRANQYWLAFFCLIPLIYVLEKTSKNETYHKKFFMIGFFWAFIYMGYFNLFIFEHVVWVGFILAFLIWLLATIYYSLFYGVGLWLFSFLKPFEKGNSIFYRYLLFPAIFVLIEWIRSLGVFGNPTGSLGYSQTAFPMFLHLGSLLGVFGISFFCILVNVCFYQLMKNANNTKKRNYITLFLIAIFVAVFSWGIFWSSFNQNYANTHDIPKVKLALIQPNHEQKVKLDSSKRTFIRNNYFDLTYEALESKPSLVFWPETITPALNLENKRFTKKLKKFYRKSKVPIIFGTPLNEGGDYYNGVVVFDGDLDNDFYRKTRLMPFGEYWPFRSVLLKIGLKGWLKNIAEYKAGSIIQPIRVNDLKIGVGICLESIYPYFLRRQVNDGADFIAIFVNLAWFFDSYLLDIYHQMSIMRAIENNRYLIQIANTGISSIIANNGVIVDRTEINKEGILINDIPYNLPKSIYLVIGDLIVYFCGFVVFVRFFKRIVTKYSRIIHQPHN
jgi:apolipoprotein N-acyltransferase